MKSECQTKFKHSIPIEKAVTLPRINLTFRYNDPKGRKNPTQSQTIVTPPLTKLVVKIKTNPGIKLPVKLKPFIQGNGTLPRPIS